MVHKTATPIVLPPIFFLDETLIIVELRYAIIMTLPLYSHWMTTQFQSPPSKFGGSS